jgi:hypothetical protein
MPTKTFETTFNINELNVPLVAGDKLYIKFHLVSTTTNNFTASFASAGNLSIGSLSTATGYAVTTCPWLDSASIASTGSNANSNMLIFSSGISSYYNGSGYIFQPNPSLPGGGGQNDLYTTYGDVDYAFNVNPFDIVLIYLSDGTFIESRVLQVLTVNGNLALVLNNQLSAFVKTDLANATYQRILLLTRQQDETNAYIVYNKRPGQTSYGFAIPNNLALDVLSNIDVITKQVKQKLLADQSIIDNINGGSF